MATTGIKHKIAVFDKDVKLPPEDKPWITPKNDSQTANKAKLMRSFIASSSKGHRLVKGILGVICGLLVGGVLFALLLYSYGFTVLQSGVSSAVIAVVLCVLFATSSRARCTGMVALPSVSTGRGRAALLSLAVALLLQGPITNMTYNVNQVAASFACGTELALNQSRELQKALEEPIRVLQQQILENVEEFKAINSNIQDAFETVVGGIKSVQEALVPARQVLQDAVSACKGRFNAAGGSCDREVNKVKSDCQRNLNSAVKKAKKALDKVKNIDKTGVDKVKDFFGGIGKRDVSSQYATHHHMDRQGARSARVKRQSEVCDSFSGSVLCAPIKVTGNVCRLPQAAEATIRDAIGITEDLIQKIQNLFRFDIIQEAPVSGDANATKSAKEILEAVKEELRQKTEAVQLVFSIISKLLSAFLFFFALQSILYVRSYLIKDKHDNVYISRNFIALDTERQAAGKETVLPLNKDERSEYIQTKSIVLSGTEKRELVRSLIPFFLHLLITAGVCFLDYALFWTLDIVRNNGHVTLTVTGEAVVELKVEGDGLFAQFIRIFIDGFSQTSTYESIVDTKVCLPNPQLTPQSELYIFAALYLGIFTLLFLQPYAQRLRHSIAAFFYPEREEERVQFLFDKILRKRSKLKGKKNQRREAERKREEKYRFLPKWCGAVRSRGQCFNCCKSRV